MRTLKFNTTEYILVDHENVIPSSFQGTLLKESYSVESIAEDATSAEDIKIYEDDELIATYYGYTDIRAISMYQNNGEMVVSVELDNHDMQTQINNLSSELNDVEHVQEEQSNDIANLNTRVDDITPYTETKTGYFGETEKTFYHVPEGRVSVFFSNYNGSYSINRVEDRLIVSFDALENETDITIQIQ